MLLLILEQSFGARSAPMARPCRDARTLLVSKVDPAACAARSPAGSDRARRCLRLRRAARTTPPRSFRCPRVRRKNSPRSFSGSGGRACRGHARRASSASSALSASASVIASVPSAAAKSRTRRRQAPRRAACRANAGRSPCAGIGDRRPEDAGPAPHDRLELGVGVKIQANWNAEPVAERCGQKPEPSCGADEGEARQVDPHRARRRSLTDDQIKLVLLHRRIEDLLHRRRQAMDLRR